MRDSNGAFLTAADVMFYERVRTLVEAPAGGKSAGSAPEKRAAPGRPLRRQGQVRKMQSHGGRGCVGAGRGLLYIISYTGCFLYRD